MVWLGGGGVVGRWGDMLLVYRRESTSFRGESALQRSLGSHSQRIWRFTGLPTFWLGDQYMMLPSTQCGNTGENSLGL